ncbi:alpha/beta fold hydrolase [Phreatobacter sp.]|uniref:alpha/beta fold hydrolase n=1 Tax=Phreatobacter sp. TaxID=1966341 RepID=UPI003F721C10
MSAPASDGQHQADEGRRVTLAMPHGTMSGLRFGSQEGEPDLLFLHANGFNAATYRPLVAPLGGRWRVLALDQRGHGFTRLPAEPSELEDWWPYARDLITLLDRRAAAGARPVVLAGHSMGATASILAASQRPRAVKRLVLADPVLMSRDFRLSLFTHAGRKQSEASPLSVGAGKRRPVFASRADALESYRTRRAFSTWQPGFLEGYVEGGFIEDPEGVRLACAPAWEAASFRSHRHNSWAALKRLAMPVRLLSAGEGSTVHGGADRVRRIAPNVAAESLPGTTHFLPMERPDVLRAALEEALTAA